MCQESREVRPEVTPPRTADPDLWRAMFHLTSGPAKVIDRDGTEIGVQARFEVEIDVRDNRSTTQGYFLVDNRGSVVKKAARE